jgi:hypothetical protein
MLYIKLEDYIPKSVKTNKNVSRTWQYGYNEKYDVVIISKTGQIGDIIEISGLKIALPLAPKSISISVAIPRGSNIGSALKCPKTFLKLHLYLSGTRCHLFLRIDGLTI